RVIADAVAQLPPQAQPSRAAQRETEAGLQDQLATVLRRLNRRSEARSAQQRAIELYDQLAREHPDVTSHADHEAAGLHFLAQLAQDEADLPKAIELMSRAVAIRERLAERSPQDHRLRMRSVRSLLGKAEMEVSAWQEAGGDKAIAEATYLRAAQRIDELNATNGDDIDVVITFATAHESLAALRSAESRHADAIREHLVVRELLASKLALWESNPDLHYQLAMVDSNLLQSYYLDQNPADAVAVGERGVEHLARGLALDARHRHLLELAPSLLARLSTAQFVNGEDDAGMQTLWRLCEKPEWGADACETGTLMLAQRMSEVEPGSPALEQLERLRRALRAAIDARGPLTAGLARPAQRSSFSRTTSRLRDYDLRVALACVLSKLEDYEQQQRVLDEALQIADSIPEMAFDRVRNLGAQRTELALQQGEPAAAAQCLEAMLTRLGPDGSGYYVAAVLFVQCMTRTDEGPERERLGARAVECLRLALAKSEVPPAAAGHANFAALCGRADYLELLAR
ncbi:MAG: hypothetical protein ABIP94_19515, partial [Planctomycetota bacterium]